MKLLQKSIQTMMLVLLTTVVFGHIGPRHENSKNKNVEDQKTNLRADCEPGISETDQEINNVRARLSTGGDLWWNRDEGLYIVPKPAAGQAPVSSIFAGGVWVGGTTRAGSLKLAGVTYRDLVTDFDWYPGPLDEGGITDAPICENWDQFFKVYADEVLRHNDNYDADPANYSCDSIPDGVRYWPATGNPYWSEKYSFDLPNQPLAGFWDENKNGIYEPCLGDFPTIEIEGCTTNRIKAKELIPDEMIFWIYNDNGGPHRLTSGEAIQMEVQVQAFAYATNDEVNDMTFQRFRLLNKAQEDLIDCYFAMWVDPDLGCPYDDFSGCDNSMDASGKPRSLAYTYNEDQVDGNNGPNCTQGINTYGFDVPIIGTDYFRGPKGPKVFARDEVTGELILTPEGDTIYLEPIPGTGIADTTLELGMTSCIFTFNAGSNPPHPATTDPEGQDIQFYNNMRGLWRTGEAVTQGGSGYNPGSIDTVRYMYDALPNDPTGWSMCNTGVSNVDTRTLQATGPLLLQPGATNELIIGVVWVPDLEYPCPDISRLQSADDVAQALFDNCFDITDGPDAPDLCGIELDRELILTLSNSVSSNNAGEQYEELDLNFNGEPGQDDTYNFEGYKVYQLSDASVTGQELNDISKARLVFQADVKNGINEIYNWTSEINPVVDGRVWTFTREVAGADEGIQRTFQVVEDQFATSSDRSLINHKPYHFLALAYAHNSYDDFDLSSETGQRRAYLEGRRNVQAYTFVPRPIVYQKLNSEYNQGAAITRISGRGNYGSELELADGEALSIIDGSFDGNLSYKPGAGPFEVKVINPLEVKNGKYRFELVGEFNGSNNRCELVPGTRWKLTNLDTGEEVASDQTIEEVNEQIINKQGFSISIGQPDEPGSNITELNGSINISLEYENDSEPWFLPVPPGGPAEIAEQLQEIDASGIILDYEATEVLKLTDDALAEDPNDVYKSVGGGAFFPYYSSKVISANPITGESFDPYLTPGAIAGSPLLRLARETGEISLEDLNNVNIVFTNNKDLWSRCVVVESASPYHYNQLGYDTEDGTRQFEIMKKQSLDRDGNPDNSGTNGFSWFPGYAIDVETGQRLNIFFGENTIYHGDFSSKLENPGITTDMIFNPSSQFFGIDGGIQEFSNVVMGGQHFIYVTRTVYDGCENLAEELSKPFQDYEAQSAITWTCLPMVNQNFPLLSVEEGIIPNDLTVRLRVNNEFGNEILIEDIGDITKCNSLDELPVYEFEFSGMEALDIEPEEYAGALENVNVVPNPYYAYSAYENSVLVNTIKITNLPERAIVTIYTLDGKFIRQFDRDEAPMIKTGESFPIGFAQPTPDLEWDMKNSTGIPVASGVYLIHVVAPELGEERVLKWFGVNRQFDPTGL